MVPEEIGPLAISDIRLHFLERASRVTVESAGDAIRIELDSSAHRLTGMSGVTLAVRLPLETALQLYARLGDAIDAHMQRRRARAHETDGVMAP